MSVRVDPRRLRADGKWTEGSKRVALGIAAQDYRASCGRASARSGRGEQPETCTDCGTETGLAAVAHSPRCPSYGSDAKPLPVEPKGKERRKGRWVSTRVHNDDGSLTFGEMARREDVARDAAAMTTGCAVDGCDETFAGTTAEGRAWAAAHRASAHPKLPGKRVPRHEPVHRLSAEGGERGRQAALDARSEET